MATAKTSSEGPQQGRRKQSLRHWVLQKGKRLRKRLFRVLARQSCVGDPQVFPRGVFAWTAGLEENWQVIRTELDQLLRFRKMLPPFQEISPDNGRIAVSDHWRVFLFYGFGERSERNCALCPETARLLAGIPKIASAWFSIMAPHYHVPTHRGVTKGLVRCHLGLIIPPDPDRCRMRVGGTMTSWEEGRCIVFDDTRRHEVWNETDQERVVLLIDVERPMRAFGRMLSRSFLALLRRSAYFRDARRNQYSWESRFHEEMQRIQKTSAAPL